MKRKPPTDPEKFIKETALLIHVIVDSVADPRLISAEDMEWFQEHCSLAIRNMDANRFNFGPDYHKMFRRQSNKGRDTCYMFVRHWFESFIKNPMRYKEHCPHTIYSAQESYETNA